MPAKLEVNWTEESETYFFPRWRSTQCIYMPHLARIHHYNQQYQSSHQSFWSCSWTRTNILLHPLLSSPNHCPITHTLQVFTAASILNIHFRTDKHQFYHHHHHRCSRPPYILSSRDLVIYVVPCELENWLFRIKLFIYIPYCHIPPTRVYISTCSGLRLHQGVRDTA